MDYRRGEHWDNSGLRASHPEDFQMGGRELLVEA